MPEALLQASVLYAVATRKEDFALRTLIENALIYNSTSRSFVEGAILMDSNDNALKRNGRIIDVLPQARHAYAHLPTADKKIDAEGLHVLPGFVDVHTHGRVGEDFNTADIDGMRRAAEAYAAVGVTSIFPTLASAPFDRLCRSAEMIRSLEADSGGAHFLGVHLEGRYLNPKRRGAHAAEYLVPPSASELEEFAEHAGVPLHISAALELDTCGAFAKKALELGATLGLGHTDATFDEAREAFERYGVSFTHLYNAMPPIHHREGGAAAFALNGGGYCELICDGLHIAPHMVALTLKNIGLDRMVLISDSMAAAGYPDGEYTIAGSPAHVVNGTARTPEGALAGSTLDLCRAVENLSRFCDIPMSDAIVAATLNPAAEVGLAGEVGAIVPGARADMIFCYVDENDKRIDISHVFVGGAEMR